MNFVVSSSELLNHLQTVGRVISSKNTLPILDNFLVEQKANELIITASDLESTLTTKISLKDSSGEEGSVALPAKILTDTLKEFPEQPLTFDINMDTLAVKITSQNGEFSIVGHNSDDFPEMPEKSDDGIVKTDVKSEILLNGISKTMFATADDELRPVMNGIFLEFSDDNLTFVASDAHKLIKYKRLDGKSDIASSFILPKKPASLLKNILTKKEELINVEFDEKNAFFTLPKFKLVCRLVEGKFPSYDSVIPTSSPNKLIIDRVELYNTLRRVNVFSNPASNLVKLHLTADQMVVSAQDIDFSQSAHENLKCQYDGEEMEIGFKSTFLLEILSNISSTNIVIELLDPTRAGIFLPHDEEDTDENILMLLMPMMINA